MEERKPNTATARPWRAEQGGGGVEAVVVVVEEDLGKTWPRGGGVAGDGPATLTMYSVAPPPPRRQSGPVRPPPRRPRAARSPSPCHSPRLCHATLPLGRRAALRSLPILGIPNSPRLAPVPSRPVHRPELPAPMPAGAFPSHSSPQAPPCESEGDPYTRPRLLSHQGVETYANTRTEAAAQCTAGLHATTTTPPECACVCVCAGRRRA